MSLLKDLPELVSANIINGETAQRITEYYKRKQASSPNRQLLIFGILGALLVGTGLMFIVANQWEELPLAVQTTCAFLLLLIPQTLCGYVMLKMPDKIVWRESTALILFFAVGASISLVSQIYHINGEMSSFMLTWTLLTVPLVYLLNSSSVSLAYLISIMVYGIAAHRNASTPLEEYLFWILFFIPLPHYFQMLKKSSENILLLVHHWMIPLVLTITLGTLTHGLKMVMYPNHIIMFALFYFFGNTKGLSHRPLLQNGYKVFGFLGTIITLLILTFQSPWNDMSMSNFHPDYLLTAPEFIAGIILFALASLLLYRQNKHKNLKSWGFMDVIYILFLLIFVLASQNTFLAVLAVNLVIFILGIFLLREGSRISHLGVLNLGMLVIALLVICRSFDTDLTFVFKGTLFVLVGIGFFAVNWLMIKKRNANEA